jgi:OOP family OmpA-OmpF porin
MAINSIEKISRDQIKKELLTGGIDWADVETIGLQVFLIGNAPDEAGRFKALSLAGNLVDAERLIDQMNVIDNSNIEPPNLKLEILKTGEDFSVYGIVPENFNKLAFIDSLARQSGVSGVVRESIEYSSNSADQNWAKSIRFGLMALEEVSLARLEITSGTIRGEVVVENLEQKETLIKQWRKDIPQELRQKIKIKSPRPLITPFSFRATKGEGVFRLDACSADNKEAASEILKEVDKLSGKKGPKCEIGLGQPSESWLEVVLSALNALSKTDEGSITIINDEISFVVQKIGSEQKFQKLLAMLENSLPNDYLLNAKLISDTEVDGNFGGAVILTLSPEGLFQMNGKVRFKTTRNTLTSLAEAKFGKDFVNNKLKIDTSMPQDWSDLVMFGIESMSLLKNGFISITNSEVSVSGEANEPNIAVKIAQTFYGNLASNQPLKTKISYVEPPKFVEPEGPTDGECLDGVNNLLVERKITFEPSSERINLDGQQLLDEIADVLRDCDELSLEIAGHTDSQGREEMNLQLSQSRATAVLIELQRRKVLTTNYLAKGYGELQPIADNDTEEGRETNRRIEFKLAPQKEVQRNKSE